jgi:hypothetical protein
MEVVALHPRGWSRIEESEPKSGEQKHIDHDYSKIHVNNHQAESILRWKS